MRSLKQAMGGLLALRLGLCGVATALFSLSPPALAETKPEEFTMVVGEDLAFQGMQEFAIENQQILSATISRDGKGVVVRALRTGNSKVLFRLDASGQKIRIVDIAVGVRNPKNVVDELDVLLKPFPNLKTQVNRMQVLVEGEVKTEQDLRNVRDILRRYEGQITELISVAPAATQRAVMIRLDFHFVAVRRRFSHRLGLTYPTSIRGSSLLTLGNEIATGGGLAVTQSAVLPSLLPTLDITEANGYIRIKRVDTIITENGTKAVYREGSELPVRVSASLGAGSLEKIFYGSELTVAPRLSPLGDVVALEVMAEISQRDNAVTQDGIPGKNLSTVRTSVQIPVGQSMMLAGIDFQSSGATLTGLPWLSRIPILGYLFGSDSKEAESAYSVVYITPTIVEKSSPLAQQQIERALRAFDKPQVMLPLTR